MHTEQLPTWGETVKERMRAKALKGVPTGPVPLGYRKVRERGEVRVEIDAATAPLVREAFRLAALKSNSLEKILVILTTRGLVSQRGTPLHPTGLWRILTNQFYIGKLIYDGKTVEGTHEPLADEALFFQVQKSLSRRRRSG